MKNRSERNVTRSLAKLGIEEVAERLEISPLLVGEEPVPEDPDDGCCCNCVCRLVPIELPGSA